MPTKTHRLPTHRRPTTPGEMLREEFLVPLGLTQAEVARRIAVPPNRLSEVISGKRTMTADTALRLGRAFGMSPQFWMDLQTQVDLWDAERKTIPAIESFQKIA